MTRDEWLTKLKSLNQQYRTAIHLSEASYVSEATRMRFSIIRKRLAIEIQEHSDKRPTQVSE